MSSFHAYYTDCLQRRKRGSLFLVLMNAFLITAIVLWTFAGILLFPIAYIFLKFGAGKSTPWITRWCIWVYGRIWQFFTRLFVSFEPPLFRPDQFATPGIIVVNHRSFFDTYCMNMLPVYDVCFAVRDWPFNIPVYNIFMDKAAYMNIEKFSWGKCLEYSRKTLNRGGFVLFFPEGHRSRTDKMTKFYSGAFKIAVETWAPIIPVCLTGTENLLPPARYYMAPTRIKMKVLDPVHPKDFQGEMKHQKLKKIVKQMMAKELAAMDSSQPAQD